MSSTVRGTDEQQLNRYLEGRRPAIYFIAAVHYAAPSAPGGCYCGGCGVIRISNGPTAHPSSFLPGGEKMNVIGVHLTLNNHRQH